jgi:hypothetical protein
VLVRDARTDATLGSGTATFAVPAQARVTAVRPGAEVYREGDTMSVVVRSAGRLEGLRLRLELRDDLDRLVFQEEKPTRGETWFFPGLEGFVGRRALASASLVEASGRVVDRGSNEGVVVVQRERRPKEYRALLSFETPPARLAALRQRRLRAEAIESGFTWGGKVNDSLEMPRGYFGVYWYDRGPTTADGLDAAIRDYERTGDFASLQYLTKKELYRRTGDKKLLVRTPSLDDPGVQRVIADVARASARVRAPYNLDYYFVGDEGSLSAYTDPVDFCWGEHTLAGFRTWLKQVYGSLDGLNRTWGSDFRDWAAVLPLTTEEARRSGRFAPWADHRTYMEVSFARAYRIARDAVREADPEGRIAISGTQVTTPWNGCDWHRLDAVVDDFLSYSGGNQWEIHRSFAKPGARVGFWTGYGRSGAAVRHEIWTAALSGVLFPNLFWSPSVVNPDLTLSRSGRDMGEAFRALRFEGIGRLLMEAERASDGIAIHYSMASVHAAGILGLHGRRREGERDTFPASRDGWVRALVGLGFSPEFVAAEEVDAGRLDPALVRVFVLPLSMAVSRGEAAAIEAFARAGGIVIADAAAGVFDEHVARPAGGLLDALFGLRISSPGEPVPAQPVTGPLRVSSEGTAWGLRGAGLAGLAAVAAGLWPEGATPLLRIGTADAAFVRHVDRGWAVYLNVPFDRCAGADEDEERAGRTSRPCRDLLGGILGHLGLRPAVAVTDTRGRPLERTRIARYRFGHADVIAVLQEPEATRARYGVDGVTAYGASTPTQAPREITVRLPHPGHVVDARTAASLGTSDVVRTKLVPGDALVLAVGPPPPELRLEGPRTAARGTPATFGLTASTAGRRLLRWHVWAPDGAFLPEYARTIVAEGPSATFRLRSALSDSAGEYRLRVTDVLSGAWAEAVLSLE